MSDKGDEQALGGGSNGADHGNGKAAGRSRKGMAPLPTKELGLVTLKELTARLGLPFKTARRMANKGQLPCVRLGQRLLYSPAAVSEHLQRRARQENAKGDLIH